MRDMARTSLLGGASTMAAHFGFLCFGFPGFYCSILVVHPAMYNSYFLGAHTASRSCETSFLYFISSLQE